MKIHILILLVIAFSIIGCTPAPTESTGGGFHMVQQQGAGVLDKEEVLSIFNDVSLCLTSRIIAPDFVLVLQPDKIIVGSLSVRGATYLDESPVSVYLYHPEWQSAGVALSVFRHEAVHVVLELTGHDRQLNASHNLPGFECGN